MGIAEGLIIIPAYNEEKNIGKVLTDIRPLLYNISSTHVLSTIVFSIVSLLPSSLFITLLIFIDSGVDVDQYLQT